MVTWTRLEISLLEAQMRDDEDLGTNSRNWEKEKQGVFKTEKIS